MLTEWNQVLLTFQHTDYMVDDDDPYPWVGMQLLPRYNNTNTYVLGLKYYLPLVFYVDVIRMWKTVKFPFLKHLNENNVFRFFRDLSMYTDLLEDYKKFQEAILLLPESKCKKSLNVFLEPPLQKSGYQASLMYYFSSTSGDTVYDQDELEWELIV